MILGLFIAFGFGASVGALFVLLALNEHTNEKYK
jgi:hypothetical protein